MKMMRGVNQSPPTQTCPLLFYPPQIPHCWPETEMSIHGEKPVINYFSQLFHLTMEAESVSKCCAAFRMIKQRSRKQAILHILLQLFYFRLELTS